MTSPLRSRLPVSLCVLSALLLTLSGCGGGVDRPETVPVSGTVMYNGDPVEGATVAFWTEGASRPATGVTNDKGEFQLSMFSANDGAVPGEHKITVTKVTGGNKEMSDEEMDRLANDPTALTGAYNEGEAAEEAPKAELPAQYGDKSTTPLKETVTESGPNEFVLQLSD